MKQCHSIKVSVFVKPEEDEKKIFSALNKLINSEAETEKDKTIMIERKAEGFNQRTITIYEAIIKKENQVNKFIKRILKSLNEQQKELLKKNAHTRIDDELFFCLRLDKQKLAEENIISVIEAGECYYIKMKLACYPKNKDAALKVIKEIFK